MLLNKYCLRLAGFASKDETRPLLNFVYADKEKTIATDGHRLVRVSNPQMPVDEFPVVPLDEGFKKEVDSVYLSPQACRDAEAGFPKKTTLSILNHALIVQNGTMAGVISTDLDNVKKTLCRQPEPGNVHAQANQILNDTLKNLPSFKADFNGAYIKEILAFLGGFEDSQVGRVTLEFRKVGVGGVGGGNLVLKAKNESTGQEATALLLPLRSKD